MRDFLSVACFSDRCSDTGKIRLSALPLAELCVSLICIATQMSEAATNAYYRLSRLSRPSRLSREPHLRYLKVCLTL